MPNFLVCPICNEALLSPKDVQHKFILHFIKHHKPHGYKLTKELLKKCSDLTEQAFQEMEQANA